jgi:anti-anti-sigma factor
MNESCLVPIEEKFGCTWIILPNCITMDNYTFVGERIHAAISRENMRVVLDLSNTNNLYSSGLGLIIRIRKQVCELNGAVYLVNVSRKIRTIFESVHLDKIFPMYSTDTEFEISQEQFSNRFSWGKFGFVFIARIENAICRLHLSGHMTLAQDLSPINNFKPDFKLTGHVFDLTGLDLVDSAGVTIIIKLIIDLNEHGSKCIAYGVNENVKGLVKLLGMDEYIFVVHDERSAMEMVEKTFKRKEPRSRSRKRRLTAKN